MLGHQNLLKCLIEVQNYLLGTFIPKICFFNSSDVGKPQNCFKICKSLQLEDLIVYFYSQKITNAQFYPKKFSNFNILSYFFNTGNPYEMNDSSQGLLALILQYLERAQLPLTVKLIKFKNKHKSSFCEMYFYWLSYIFKNINL